MAAALPNTRELFITVVKAVNATHIASKSTSWIEISTHIIGRRVQGSQGTTLMTLSSEIAALTKLLHLSGHMPSRDS